MGKSNQSGSIVLRGKRWYGYYRKVVIDPTTDNARVVKVVVRLGLKSQMTKLAAREALRAEIAKQTGQLAGGKLQMDSAATFEWFVRHRYFPLRQGDWRPETAKEKKSQIEIDLVAKFGPRTLDSIDKFELQTHVNDLAKTYSQDRVKQARSYLMSIFDEAIEQEFLVKDPSRKLKIPRNLRPKDKRILTWEQLAAVLNEATRRDRLIILLDMTEALRPSELFAIRWRTYDDANTLDLTETIYRGQIRPFGKTPKSLGKMHLPEELADEVRVYKLEQRMISPELIVPNAPMFPNADGGFIDTSNYRERVLKPLGESVGISKLNFQLIRRTIATRAQRLGSVKDIQSHLRHSRADTTANEYMQELPESVQQMVGTVYAMLTTSKVPERVI
jgi:integrase